MLLGTDIRGALATLERWAPTVIGLNCSTGPDLMRDAVRYLSQHASTPIHCIPKRGAADHTTAAARCIRCGPNRWPRR